LMVISSSVFAHEQSPETDPYNKKVRVLAIDGGGIRGLYAANILRELEARTQKPLSSLFDVIAGTSTGGILALGLTTPNAQGQPKFTTENLVKLYESEGNKIFEKSLIRQIQTLGGLGQNKYSHEGLNSILFKYFGNTTLSQALTNVMVTSYNIEEARPYLFRSDKAKKSLSEDHYMLQAARATSAAPTYFSPAHFIARDGKRYTLVDGGIIDNNPALDALLLSKLLYPNASDFLVASVGTGDLRKGLAYSQVSKQGELGWITEIVGMIMDGTSILTDERLQALLNNDSYSSQKYYRFQWPFPPENGEMDDTSSDNIMAINRLSRDAVRFFSRDLDALSSKLVELKQEEMDQMLKGPNHNVAPQNSPLLTVDDRKLHDTLSAQPIVIKALNATDVGNEEL